MKSFKNVYKASKSAVLNEQQKLFAADKAKLVATMKHEYGVKDFGTLKESEKASYKAMLAEMWTPSTGLTEKGVMFLNESKAPLTEKSTPEQIEKFFKKEFKAGIENSIELLAKGINDDRVKKIKETIEADIKRTLPKKDIKQWMYAVACDFIGSKIKSVKF